MKKLWTIAIWLLMMVVFVHSTCAGYALTTTEKENKYNATIDQLEVYLESFGNQDDDSTQLSDIIENFSELDGFNYSKAFFYYTQVLLCIETSNYTDWHTEAYLEQVCKNEKFNKYINESGSTGIANAETLKNYYLGRMAEHEGDHEQAIAYYSECIGYFDASDRSIQLQENAYESAYQQAEALMNQGRLEEAYALYKTCRTYKEAAAYADYIVGKLGYEPGTCGENHQFEELIIRDATCVQTGEKKLTCTVCGKTETVETGKNSSNHTSGTELKNEKAATCGTSGYTGDTYCKGCGKIIKSGSTIAATGKHSWKAATYEAPKTCSVCGKTEGSALKKEVKTGEYITFGHYPQTASGTDSTPIEWLVLEVDTKNNRALIISKYGLDAKPYNTSDANVTWETCTLRTWLNNTFLNAAFSTEEQQAILTATVDNSQSQCYNGWWSTSGGKNTQDKVFLLSYAEAHQYFGLEYYDYYRDSNGNYNPTNIKSRVVPTAYAIAQGAGANSYYRTETGEEAGWWWLRSPGNSQRYAALVVL